MTEGIAVEVLQMREVCGVACQQKISLGGSNCIVSSQQGQTCLLGFEIVQEKLFNLCITFIQRPHDRSNVMVLGVCFALW